ncbi:MAG TPA: AAA family ATPase [Candidatus Udaeobacter sp.]
MAAGSDCVAIDEVNPVWLKTPAAPIVGAVMEKVTIDIEQILSAFGTLQERVEYVVVEGTGGWLVPIRSKLFWQRFGRGNEAAAWLWSHKTGWVVLTTRSSPSEALPHSSFGAWVLY